MCIRDRCLLIAQAYVYKVILKHFILNLITLSQITLVNIFKSFAQSTLWLIPTGHISDFPRLSEPLATAFAGKRQNRRKIRKEFREDRENALKRNRKMVYNGRERQKIPCHYLYQKGVSRFGPLFDLGGFQKTSCGGSCVTILGGRVTA